MGKKKKSLGLGAIEKIIPVTDEKRSQQYMLIGSIGGGAFLGALFDKYSGYAGAVFTLAGVAAKNRYLTSFGTSMMVGMAGKKVANYAMQGIADDQEKEFSFEGLMDEAKENGKGFFKVLGAKFMLPFAKTQEQSTTTDQSTSGLHGNEKVTYFVNPYSGKTDKIDLSELDKVQQQITQMNGAQELELAGRNL